MAEIIAMIKWIKGFGVFINETIITFSCNHIDLVSLQLGFQLWLKDAMV